MLTGHDGFVGRTLVSFLAAVADPRWRVATLPDGFDIRSPELEKRTADTAPDAVLHLAGRTSVAESFAKPREYFEVNFGGTWNLLEALRATRFSGRMVFVSSGDCYGAVADDALPITEREPLRPRSPYAVSKTAAEALCYQWAQTEPFGIVVARPFNHIGPRQASRFATASFARQLARIRLGLQAPRIATGNLDVTRDLTDVRDVVCAYLALLDHGRDGDIYNIGSGREALMRDVLHQMIAMTGIDVEVVVDPGRVRNDEQRRAVADVRKIERDTHWRSAIPLDRTLRDMLDDWMERAEHE